MERKIGKDALLDEIDRLRSGWKDTEAALWALDDMKKFVEGQNGETPYNGDARGIIRRIGFLEDEVLNYITSTEHWLLYWIENKEVQNFIREYPEDYESMVHLSVRNVSASPLCRIVFDRHPDDVKSIERYCVLSTFRKFVMGQWMQWKGQVRKKQIKEKEEEVKYFKRKLSEAEEQLKHLKDANKEKLV